MSLIDDLFDNPPQPSLVSVPVQPKVSGGLLDSLPASAFVDHLYSDETDNYQYKGNPVGWSADLKRIMALPRRTFNDTDPRAAEVWTQHLKNIRTGPCDCDARWGVKDELGNIVPGSGCITKLKPIQGWALEEAYDTKGLLGILGVGHGKTGLDILLPWALFPHKAARPSEAKVVLLLIPPKLKRRFFTKDYPQWAAHFEVPNLAGQTGASWKGDGRPVLEVLSYSELSTKRNTDVMTRVKPDAIIADEAHKLKNKGAVRTDRFLKVFSAEYRERTGKANPYYIPMSGTMTDKSLKEYAHHAAFALGQNSPLPLAHNTLEEWSSAIDPSDRPAPVGRLRNLCEGNETVQQGFARRLFDTKGVITTSTASVNCGLEIAAVPSPRIPEAVQTYLSVIRDDEVRPDGEESDGALTTANWAREMASGFYSYWAFPKEFKELCRHEGPCVGLKDKAGREPNCEAVMLIDRWFAARKAYNKAVRLKLYKAREFIDSPDLVKDAAKRWFDGYEHDGVKYPPKSKGGPLPVWDSSLPVDADGTAKETWPVWRDLEDKVQPQPRTKWIDTFLVDATIAWGKANIGVIWCEHKEFGKKVAASLGVPYYDGGGKEPELDEKGDRTIVCSIRANNEGSNLQFTSKALIVHMQSSGLISEQMIGRQHRQGQRAEVVEIDVFLHTKECRRSFDTACRRAFYAQTTNRTPNKLCIATIDLTHAVDDD